MAKFISNEMDIKSLHFNFPIMSEEDFILLKTIIDDLSPRTSLDLYSLNLEVEQVKMLIDHMQSGKDIPRQSVYLDYNKIGIEYMKKVYELFRPNHVQTGENISSDNPCLSPLSADLSGNGLLWKLEKEGSPASYIFGTHHVIHSSFAERVYEYIDKARIICVEKTDFELPEEYRKLPLNMSLLNLLEKDIYIKMRQFFLEKQIIWAEYLQPWILFLHLQASLRKQILDTGSATFEELLIVRAKQSDTPIASLESDETSVAMINLLSGLFKSFDEQVQLITLFIDQYEEFKQKSQEIYNSYLQGDMVNSYNIAAAEFGALFKTIITDRDECMVNTMQPHLIEGNAFLAVGLCHLPGILKQLKSKGYIVSCMEQFSYENHPPLPPVFHSNFSFFKNHSDTNCAVIESSDNLQP